MYDSRDNVPDHVVLKCKNECPDIDWFVVHTYADNTLLDIDFYFYWDDKRYVDGYTGFSLAEFIMDSETYDLLMEIHYIIEEWLNGTQSI